MTPATPLDDREIRLATILFADVRNSAQISNVLTLREHDQFISQFQGVMRQVLDEEIERGYAPDERESVDCGCRGDEAFLIVSRAKDLEDAERDIEVALRVAFRMKREWLMTDFNQRRLIEGKMIEDIGLGIHVGFPRRAGISRRACRVVRVDGVCVHGGIVY